MRTANRKHQSLERVYGRPKNRAADHISFIFWIRGSVAANNNSLERPYDPPAKLINANGIAGGLSRPDYKNLCRPIMPMTLIRFITYISCFLVPQVIGIIIIPALIKDLNGAEIWPHLGFLFSGRPK